jgi:hypothetical protein
MARTSSDAGPRLVSDRDADQPILSGLRYILERGVELDEDDADPEWAWLAPTPLSSCCEAWRH